METNANRITNICYPRGSIIYASFSKGSEYYFLNMRPLIVISVQNQMFDSLNVIACGSRDRPGVEISLFNHMRGKWIGDHQFSVAQPYAMYTVMVNQIIEFHGVIDPFTMKAIDKAVAFHLGMTEEVPPYMKDIYEELMAPRYSMGTSENTQLNDPHQMGSPNETTRSYASLFKKYPGRVAGKPYPKPTENLMFSPTVYTLPDTSDDKEEEVRPTEPSKVETPMVGTPVKTEIPKVNVTINQDAETEESTKKTKTDRIGTATLIVPDPNGMVPVSDTILNIVMSLTDDDKVKAITRKLEAGKYGADGNITVYANQVGQIRRGIEYTYINEKFSQKMRARICKRQSNFRFLSEFEKAGCIMYCTPEELGISESIFNEVARQFIREQHLQFDDGRSWKGLANFERLKKIYKR